jgi:hypothetical protein
VRARRAVPAPISSAASAQGSGIGRPWCRRGSSSTGSTTGNRRRDRAGGDRRRSWWWTSSTTRASSSNRRYRVRTSAISRVSLVAVAPLLCDLLPMRDFSGGRVVIQIHVHRDIGVLPRDQVARISASTMCNWPLPKYSFSKRRSSATVSADSGVPMSFTPRSRKSVRAASALGPGHSRRIELIRRSIYGFCHGDPSARSVDRRIPIALTRDLKAHP